MSSTKRFVKVRTFEATDTDGRIVQIDVWQTRTQVSGLSGSTPELDGPISLKTSDGQEVSHVAKGKYTIATTGEQLSSDDPDAL